MSTASTPACSRRTLLRGLGVSMALPWLESLPRAVAAATAAATDQPPTRTLVTFTGHGFDAFFGALNDTLCRWGNATHSPVTAPVSIQPTTLICPTVAQPPGSVDVFIALTSSTSWSACRHFFLIVGSLG